MRVVAEVVVLCKEHLRGLADLVAAEQAVELLRAVQQAQQILAVAVAAAETLVICYLGAMAAQA